MSEDVDGFLPESNRFIGGSTYRMFRVSLIHPYRHIALRVPRERTLLRALVNLEQCQELNTCILYSQYFRRKVARGTTTVLVARGTTAAKEETILL
eukprot:2297198-Amphidinium_carterae.1